MWHMETVVISVVVGARAWYSKEGDGRKYQRELL